MDQFPDVAVEVFEAIDVDLSRHGDSFAGVLELL